MGIALKIPGTTVIPARQGDSEITVLQLNHGRSVSNSPIKLFQIEALKQCLQSHHY